MKNVLLVFGVACVLLIAGFYAFNAYIYNEKQADVKVGETVSKTGKVLAVDMSQIAFDGPYLLTLESDGKVSSIAVPSMGLPLCAAYQENNIGDVSLLKTGDEIEVRGILNEDGSIVPCESSDHYLRTTPIVVENFEGEANPAQMSLTMKKWTWVSALYNDGTSLMPKKAGAFTITFNADGNFGATTDCNSMGGTYKASNGQITFGQTHSTLMFCAESQETEFGQLLSNTSGYHFTSKGELILDLKFDSGSVVFR